MHELQLGRVMTVGARLRNSTKSSRTGIIGMSCLDLQSDSCCWLSDGVKTGVMTTLNMMFTENYSLGIFLFAEILFALKTQTCLRMNLCRLK